MDGFDWGALVMLDICTDIYCSLFQKHQAGGRRVMDPNLHTYIHAQENVGFLSQTTASSVVVFEKCRQEVPAMLDWDERFAGWELKANLPLTERGSRIVNATPCGKGWG